VCYRYGFCETELHLRKEENEENGNMDYKLQDMFNEKTNETYDDIVKICGGKTEQDKS